MYIEIEAPSRHATKEDPTHMYVGPFADRAAAESAINQAPNATWETQRRITGDGVTLMARAIVAGRRRRYPVAPYIPRDREEFALMAYQYA